MWPAITLQEKVLSFGHTAQCAPRCLMHRKRSFWMKIKNTKKEFLKFKLSLASRPSKLWFQESAYLVNDNQTNTLVIWLERLEWKEKNWGSLEPKSGKLWCQASFTSSAPETKKETPSYQRWHWGPLTDSSVFTQALRTRLSDICEGSKTVLTCCMKGSCHGWPRGWGIGSPFSGHFTAWMARLWCILACVSGGAGRLRGRRGTAFHSCTTKNKEAAQKEGLACWAEDLLSGSTQKLWWLLLLLLLQYGQSQISITASQSVPVGRESQVRTEAADTYRDMRWDHRGCCGKVGKKKWQDNPMCGLASCHLSHVNNT